MSLKNFNLDNYLKELEYIVNIDSGSYYLKGIEEIVKYFKQKYKDVGLFIDELNFNEEVGPCLEVKNKKNEDYDILLLGHMDTVFPKGTVKKRPFKIEGEYAYGPGVSDMKSGILSAYYVIDLLKKENKLKDISICIALNSHEEISSIYSRKWIEKLSKKSSYVFTLESARPNGALVLERKGLGKYNVDFMGKAAHSGVEPQKGISAIQELAQWIIELHDLTDFKTGTTVNVGKVVGGTAANVVAEQAEAKIDFRFKDINEAEKVINKVNNLKSNPFLSGIKVDLDGGVKRPPMNSNEKTEYLCNIIEKVGKKLNIDIKWAYTGGGSDANFSAALGIPTIDGMGPVGGGFHSSKEFLDLKTIEPRIELLKRVIEKIIL
ncbi:MAG: M20 family metallopeptidase [Candidatus Woesearchaeota archaeon]